MRSFISLIAALALLSACAQRPLSTRERGAVTGAALGAGTGALIGSATGNAGTGAAIGAGLGLLTGGVVGGAIENQREERAYPPPAVGSTQSSASTHPGQSQARMTTPTTATANPTVGQFVNGTRWRIKVFVDADPKAVEAASAIVLNPQETRQHNLNLGSHRIIAQAHVDTQFGTRTVGRSELTIHVGSRGSGWTLRFHEADFR